MERIGRIRAWDVPVKEGESLEEIAAKLDTVLYRTIALNQIISVKDGVIIVGSFEEPEKRKRR
jgi:hypothetical protein